jgi:hypothetical protein
VLPIMLLILFYYVLPFLGFLVAHWLYIWFGRLLISPFSKPTKVVFWVIYSAFGLILIYTNLIWSGDDTSLRMVDVAKDPARYAKYRRHYLDTTQYAPKVMITGEVGPSMHAEFSVNLINHDKHCQEEYTISRHGNGWYRHEERITYPPVGPGPYEIEIYLENHKTYSDCIFKAHEGIDVVVYGKRRQHSFHSAEIGPQRSKYRDHKLIEHESARIVCKEGTMIGRKKDGAKGMEVTQCKNHADENTPLLAWGKTDTIRLDIVAEGEVTGRTLYYRGENSPITKMFLDTFRKFKIGEIPSFDPR